MSYAYEFDADAEPDGTIDDLTLVTSLVEMDPDGTGSGTESTTTIDYYWSDDPNAKGQVWTVTDENNVQHRFRYNALGYSLQTIEGHPAGTTGPNLEWMLTELLCDINDVGWVNYACDPDLTDCEDSAAKCSGVIYDLNGNPTDADCPGDPRLAGDYFPRRLGYPPAAWITPLQTCSTGNEYDALDRPTVLNACYSDPEITTDEGARTADMTYDALSRLLTMSVASTEHRGSGLLELTQTWDYDDWQSAGEVSVTAGPDGQESTYTFAVDDLGRPASVSGGGMSMTYAYDDASRVDDVDYGNGTRVDYEYDDADRVLSIEHFGPGPATLYKTEYEWNPNNTVASRTETDNSSGSTVEAVVSFEYDARDRLIQETRVRQGDPDVTEYDIEYLYDDLGNRLQKSQTTATDGDPVTVVTDYVYDITAPDNDFVTKNNRLMYYTETVDSELRRTVYYTYYETGDVSNITIKDETSPNTRSDLALTYARNGGLWLAVWGDYNVDATTQEYVEDSYVPSTAREFRYESGRGRYMSRGLTWNSQQAYWQVDTAWTYTEYLGDTPIADWDIDLDGTTNEPVWTKLRTYLPGSSSGDAAGAQLNADDDSIQYYHGDLVGSTIGTTDADGTNGVFDGPAITVAYTAFGELVANDGDDNISIGFAAPAGFPRYQYCGNWGYETGGADGSGAMLSLSGANGALPPIRLMHVGARWYDPALGRFVQRDPVGLRGGLKCYAYCADNPAPLNDPSGLEISARRLAVWCGAAAGAAFLTEVLYGLYIQGQMAAGTAKLGTKLAITDTVLQYEHENDIRPGRWKRVPDSRFMPSAHVTRCLFLRTSDGRVSITYIKDGTAYQFYAGEHSAR